MTNKEFYDLVKHLIIIIINSGDEYRDWTIAYHYAESLTMIYDLYETERSKIVAHKTFKTRFKGKKRNRTV